jgi:hypothetical protein
MASVWTSQYPDRHHGDVSFSSPLPKDRLTLAEVLSGQGILCAGFVANPIAGGFNRFDRGFLEWVLRKHDVKKLYCAGIVTNGGVASTVRDAHVRDFDVIVLEDGCAAFSKDVHRAAIEGLRPVARIATIDEAMQEFAIS